MQCKEGSLVTDKAPTRNYSYILRYNFFVKPPQSKLSNCLLVNSFFYINSSVFTGGKRRSDPFIPTRFKVSEELNRHEL